MINRIQLIAAICALIALTVGAVVGPSSFQWVALITVTMHIGLLLVRGWIIVEAHKEVKKVSEDQAALRKEWVLFQDAIEKKAKSPWTVHRKNNVA